MGQGGGGQRGEAKGTGSKMGSNPTQHKGRANVGNVGFLLVQKPESGSTPPFHFIRTVLGEGARTIIGALTWLLPFTVHFPE